MIYDFRVDILRNYVKIGEALCSQCRIKFDKNADVKKGMQLTMSADKIKMTKAYQGLGQSVLEYAFDMFSDRLRPVVTIDGTEHPLGIYMVISAPESLSDTGSVYNLESYDESMILKQSAFTERTNYTAGTEYLTVINSILTACGFTRVVEDPTTAVLATDIEIAPGETYLSVLNTFLDGINYEHIYMDNDGYIHVQAVENKTTADFVYSDRKNMRIIPPITKTTDLYNLPNVLVGVCSLPELDDPITYTKENTDPNSKISIPSRGYKVVKVYNLYNTADQQALEDYIDQRYYESTQVTETVDISTAIEGGHVYGNTVQIDTSLLQGLFNETQWEIQIGSNGGMKHRLERKVFV